MGRIAKASDCATRTSAFETRTRRWLSFSLITTAGLKIGDADANFAIWREADRRLSGPASVILDLHFNRGRWTSPAAHMQATIVIAR
jgi:hypothetical protein